MQVAIDSILLLVESEVGLHQIGIARVLRDQLVRLVAIVVSGLLHEDGLELLLVYSLGLHAHFDEHLHDLLEANSFDLLAVPLLLDFVQH